MPDLSMSKDFSKYIADNWDVLAASAYSHYLKQGRGLLWVDWLNQIPMRSRPDDVGAVYCTRHTAITRTLFPIGMSDDVRRLIRQYDPESAIVLYWLEGGIAKGRTIALSGGDSPKTAYDKLKGRLDEFEMTVDLEPEL